MLSIAFLFITSCDIAAILTYKMQTNTSFPVKVIRTKTDGTAFTDTIIIVKNAQTVIAVNGEGLDRVSKYKEVLDTLRRFPRMDI